MIHLHNHSEFSFLDGLPTMEGLVARAEELGQSAIAVTDHGNVGGHLRFQREARRRGIKPIFGMEGYFTDDRTVREGRKGEKYEHITLIAQTEEGLRNLWTLSSRGFLDGFHYDPRVDWALLEKYSAGLVATSGCLSGCVASRFNPKSSKYDEQEGLARLGRFLNIFGDRFLIELHTFDNAEQRAVNEAMARIAASYGIRAVAVSDSHYLRPGDWESHELLVATQTGKTFDDPTRYTYGEGQLYVLSEADVRDRLAYLGPEIVEAAIANTHWVADGCEAEIKTANRIVPVYFDTEEQDRKRLLDMALSEFDRRITLMGIKANTEQWKAYRVRLLDELELVMEKGFAGYFLIVRDVVMWAKERGILVGPSRGSVGGSLLAYILGITEVDPVRADLLFGRFLDPGRTSLPDIDLDFPKLERPLVREYLESKYHVATIGTLTSMQPRMLLRDIARVLKVPKQDVEQMVRVVEGVKDLTIAQVGVTWADVLDEVGAELSPWIKKYPKMFTLVGEFNQHIRHAAAHAAGVVLSKEPLDGVLPLRKSNDDVRTQMEMGDVEALGFVKIDILGLRTLSTLMRALTMAQDSWKRDPKGRPEPKHFYDWQYNWSAYYEDEKVFQSLWGGKNVGVFQIETDGMRDVVKRYKPDSLEGLCNLVSIFRPGITRASDPETGLNLLDSFLQKREGRLKVNVRHPLLAPILEPTYGQFVYQEQVMRACGELAGFDLKEQDGVRKILGKGHKDDMATIRQKFIDGAVANGVDKRTAAAIFGDMEAFGVYGFNKAHGYAYGMLAYWCAWMKNYYPHEMMAALFQTNPEKAVVYQRECQRLGISVLGPDIHESGQDFTLTDNGTIRYGLNSIKYVAGAAELLAELRPFKDIQDFATRVPKRRVTKRVVESLVLVGAIDGLVTGAERERFPDWPPTRIALRRYWEARGDWAQMDRLRSEDGLREFDAYADGLGVDNRAASEEEMLGSVVSVSQPFGPYIDFMTRKDTYPGEDKMLSGEVRVMCGVVRKVRKLVAKSGRNKDKPMCQMWLERPAAEEAHELEQVVCFPEQYKVYSDAIEVGVPVYIKVEKMGRGDGVMVTQLVRIDQMST